MLIYPSDLYRATRAMPLVLAPSLNAMMLMTRLATRPPTISEQPERN